MCSLFIFRRIFTVNKFQADYGCDASAWGRRIFDTEEIDIHFEPDTVTSKVFAKKEDIEYEETLKDLLTCDEEKLKELGIWDKIYDKCKGVIIYIVRDHY